ncbi:unnamed protein product [Allacma fusca]|uniref:Transmembrane protein n=1 Tax=Allacma fusca TaxID=39272 RepID=A0A8J2PWM6_9HEXA|nr:unnamed protein product [Allacma fusca]
MKLPPRNPNKDKLVTPQLMSYTYGQSSVFQLGAGFFCYFLTLGYHGFLPHRIIGLRAQWDSGAINDLEDSYGQEWV